MNAFHIWPRPVLRFRLHAHLVYIISAGQVAITFINPLCRALGSNPFQQLFYRGNWFLNQNGWNKHFAFQFLRQIIDASWYISNKTIHDDHNISLIEDVISNRSLSHHFKLENHPNHLIAPLYLRLCRLVEEKT